MVTPDAVDVAMTTGDGGSVAPLSSWRASPGWMPGPGDESGAGVGPGCPSEGCSDISRSAARGRAHNLRERDHSRSLGSAPMVRSWGDEGELGASRASDRRRQHGCVSRWIYYGHLFVKRSTSSRGKPFCGDRR